MMNAFIRAMTQTPGKYYVTSFHLAAFGKHYAVEVDANGVVHQLNPQGQRDGILRPQGWIGDELVLDARVMDTINRQGAIA